MMFLNSLLEQKETVGWCLYWFTANLTITFFNKYCLSGLNISPLVNTLSHMSLTFLGCLIVEKGKFPILTKQELKRLFIYSFIFSINIVYSQFGMKLTTLSLNQVTRATTPLYQASLEYLLMSRIHLKYNLIPLIPVICGVAMTSFGELNLSLFSLFICITSVFISALKGVLSMKLLQRDLKAKLQEYSFLLIVAPMASIWIIIFELIIRSFNEGNIIWFIFGEPTVFNNNNNSDGIFDNLPWKYLILGGCFAFIVNVASIGTVKRTSSTSMGVMANAKQAITIFASMLLAEKDWTWIKFLGICVTLCGAIWYSYRKEMVRQREAKSSNFIGNNDNRRKGIPNGSLDDDDEDVVLVDTSQSSPHIRHDK